jgi:hypothetical protein
VVLLEAFSDVDSELVRLIAACSHHRLALLLGVANRSAVSSHYSWADIHCILGRVLNHICALELFSSLHPLKLDIFFSVLLLGVSTIHLFEI